MLADYPFNKQQIYDMAGLSRKDLADLVKRHPNIMVVQEDNSVKYKIWSLCKALNDDLRKVQGKKDLAGIDNVKEVVDAENVKLRMDEQRLLNMTMKNQIVLGTMILKEAARARSIKFLTALQAKMKEFIHLVSEESRREVEKMTTKYNECTEELWEEAFQQDWASEGDEELLQNRMKLAAEADPEFGKILNQGGKK